MELDFQGFPNGDFGVVLFDEEVRTDGIRIRKSVIDELYKIKNSVNRIYGETPNRVQIPFEFEYFMKLFKTKDICFKLFFNTNKDVNGLTPAQKEKNLFYNLNSALNPQEIETLTPYRFVSQDCFFIVFELNTHLGVRIAGKGLKNLIRLEFIVNAMYPKNFNDVSNINVNVNSVIEDVITLSKKGVFHKDIKRENMMISETISEETKTNDIKLIDFGSCVVDDGSDVISKDKIPIKSAVHPLVYLYKQETDMGEERGTSMSRIVDTIPCNIYGDVFNVTQKKLLDRYMFYKNECFVLAQTLFKIGLITVKSGGGLLSCFKPSAVKDEQNSKKQNRPIETIEQYRARFNNTVGSEKVARLIYFDIDDYNEFVRDYKIHKAKPEQPVLNGGKYKKSKSHIRMKNAKKIHKVRVDKNGKKYIKMNKTDVYLSNIKNKYVYA